MNPDPNTVTLDDDWELRWVLGGLTAPELRLAEERLAADPALRTELAAQREALYQQTLYRQTLYRQTLPSALGDLDAAPVPQGAEERLMARLREQQQENAGSAGPGPRPRRWPWALLAVATVALLAALLSLPGAPGEAEVAYQDRPGAVALPLRADAGAGASLGTVVRLPGGEVVVQLDRAAPPGQVYQLWALRGEEVASLGTFERELALRISDPAGLSLAVSVEPPGGSPLPTSDPIAVLPL